MQTYFVIYLVPNNEKQGGETNNEKQRSTPEKSTGFVRV